MPTEIIGIDHIYLAVTDLARSEKFYDSVMTVFGFRKNRFDIGGQPHVQYFNRHFGLVLRPAAVGAPPHDAYHPGLHHLCLRVDDVAALALAARELREAGVDCGEPRHFPEYAADYHAIFLRDPDGIRLEVTNYRQERRDRHLHWDDPGMDRAADK